MKKHTGRAGPVELLALFGKEILASPSMQREKKFMQHGRTSCFEHSVRVAYLSLLLAKKIRLSVDARSLVRGALLHDYFLYDWHIPEPGRRLHGLFHPRAALLNAVRDFSLNPREEDIIRKHMFPLTLAPPKYRESLLVILADKICAVCEVLSIKIGGNALRALLLFFMLIVGRVKYAAT